MMRLARHVGLGITLACALVACSSATSPPASAPPTDAPTPEQPDASAGPAPEPLPADPLASCPDGYKDKRPVAGLNEGFTVAGQQREFVLIEPPATFTGPRPLFVGFNGTSENGTRFAARAKLADFAAKGFVVVVPSSAGNGSFWPIWDAMRAPGSENGKNADLELFDALVGCTAAHLSIDKTRIFVGGHSAGGIFTNKVLRSRSELVAGGIVGSGVFSLTSNGTSAPLSDMFVVVTWGGDNDTYRGTTPNGVTVPEFSFVEQASLASQHYDKEPKVQQAQCRGNDLGHAWLPINGWFIDALLAHPKGGPRAPVPAAPVGAAVTCSESPYVAPPLPAITCGASATAGCQAACQLMADCVGENRTVGTVMKQQLADFGFVGTSCGGCLTRCEQASSGASNAAALSCFAQHQASAQCGAGIEGSFPLMTAVDACCAGRTDASFCVGLCTSINKNGAAAAFFPECKRIAP
ncbi:MAG: prolyl oligopeptidase family serine peptidase [Myxococcales bacterium]|nr:prolyl oligopeptidase family serine peptidase [Myxococcales bacterium]